MSKLALTFRLSASMDRLIVKKTPLLVLSGYLLLTILMTWPTVARMATAIPGDGFDGWQNYWNQWWIKEALLVKGTHFFFTDILYPPNGASLLFHTLNFFNGLWTLPLQLNFGLAVAYNMVVLYHFTFSAFGVYLLVRYTLAHLHLGSGARQAGAAFVAGLIFTFSPFHMAHLLGHMQVFSLTWPPFYMLWLLRTLNRWRLQVSRPDAGGLSEGRLGVTGLPPRDLALMGLFLTLTTMVDWYQTLYLLLFTALIVIWAVGSVWRDKEFSFKILWPPVLGLVGMGLIFGLLFSPLIAPMAAEAATADYMRPSFEENIILSADLLAFFVPSELHPWWGEWVTPIYQTFTSTTSERLIFAGFTPLLLGLYGAIQQRKRRLVQAWSIVTLTFFILALGPYLHVAGQIIKIGDTPLSLPYLFLYKVIPFIGISRSLSRFDLIVMIGLALLAAVGLVRFKLRFQVLAGLLICLEFAVLPYPMSPIDTPDFFKTIAQDKEDYTIAALPMNWDRPSPLLYQTVHRKRLLTAYTSRQNPLDLSWRTPVLQQWRTLNDDIIKTDLAAVAPTILHDFKLKYIVLDYYQMPPGPEREATEKWVTAALPMAAPIYDDGRLKVYQAPALAERQPYLQLGPTWGALETIAGRPARTLPEVATLHLTGFSGLTGGNSGPSQAPQLQIETSAPYSLHGLKVVASDESLAHSISADGLTATVTLPPEITSLQLVTTASLPITRLGIVRK